mmetsp:Transcript_34382/g.67725  ORF Transcript_34382/g.67725 Transcript_34382/m.67725 type:complete len:87 (+) Transcript_34382:151-411(+)
MLTTSQTALQGYAAEQKIPRHSCRANSSMRKKQPSISNIEPSLPHGCSCTLYTPAPVLVIQGFVLQQLINLKHNLWGQFGHNLQGL